MSKKQSILSSYFFTGSPTVSGCDGVDQRFVVLPTERVVACSCYRRLAPLPVAVLLPVQVLVQVQVQVRVAAANGKQLALNPKARTNAFAPIPQLLRPPRHPKPVAEAEGEVEAEAEVVAKLRLHVAINSQPQRQQTTTTTTSTPPTITL
jgi:hypothetical protein